MKPVLYLLTVFLLPLLAVSQSLPLNFTIQSGVSLPLGAFAGKNLDGGSFTLPGLSVSGEVAIQTETIWGAFAQAGIQLNPVDVGALGSEKVKADPFLADVYIRSEAFRVAHLLAGAVISHKPGRILEMEYRAGAGAIFSATPYQYYWPKYEMLGSNNPYEISSSLDVSFAGMMGAGIFASPTGCYRIGLSGQIIHSVAAFDFVTQSGIRTDKRTITMLNVTASIQVTLFNLGK
ncbi:MAG TPA: hypothetical protein PLV51_05345 [Lentimicrobium sp.]|jgi:hypothetical protein|nr:hypothetical protein [Lentimicrobium sp.]